VSKSAGVFHFGIEDRAEQEKKRVYLRKFMRQRQKNYGTVVSKAGENRRVMAVASFVAVAAARRFRV
jgi:hypothetical protein